MEVILSILVALFGIGFGIFMALQPEDAIALHDRGRYTQTEPTEKYIKQTRLEGIGLSVLCAGHRAVEYHSAGSCISGLHRFCHLQPVLPRQPGRQG